MRIAAILFALFVAGCGLTPQGDVVREAVAVKGAKVYDEGLSNAEWFVCHAASIGSVRRAYGQTSETSDTYRRFCRLANPEADLVSPDD